MYLEIKSVISGIGTVLILFVCSQILLTHNLLGFLLFVCVFTFIFSDIILGIKIIKTNANYWFDPLPQGTHELCIIKTLSGLVDIFPVTKGPKGKRYGVLHKKKIAVLNEGDDITFFEYAKKHNRTKGPALIGIEVQQKENYKALVENLNRLGFEYEYINDKPQLFQYLI